MKKIVKADYIDGYTLNLTFSDNTKKTTDLSKFLWWEVFEPLKKIENFKKFKIDKDFWVITWYNWADLATESLIS